VTSSTAASSVIVSPCLVIAMSYFD
jgi:hypothetical protein